MFAGFTRETVEFLWGIRLNNDKAWFAARKEIYLSNLYQPMTDLADEMLEYTRQKRPKEGLIRRVTRIYRDARRLYGRGPYKDHLWFTIERPSEDWTGKPAYWFEVTPDGWNYGLGFWRPSPVVMAKTRNLINRDPAILENLTRRLHQNPEFAFSAEYYKRPKAKAPSEILTPWYQAKSLALIHEEPWTEELYSREIVRHIQSGFDFLLPYYDYLRRVESEPEPPKKI